MENLSISSVSLPIELVGRILEEWLNANRFRVAHRVTGVDVIDTYDRVGGVVHVDLEMVNAAAPDVGALLHHTALAVTEGYDHGLNGGSAKNGGGAKPVKTEVAPESPTAVRKRGSELSEGELDEIVRGVNANDNRDDIARRLHIGKGRLYAAIAELRAAGRIAPRIAADRPG